jgi:membrane protein DedA with SNARE-associated domain
MHWISSLITNYEPITYLIVFVAIFVEGDISLLIFGALSKERVLDFFLVVPVAILAAILHDVIFWRIGIRFSKTKKRKYLFFNFDKASELLDRIKPTMGIYVLLSKFAWNFSRIIIISSGYVGMRFKKFIRYSAASSFLWTITYMSIGYVFADQTNIFRQKIVVAGTLMAGVVLIMALFEIYIKKILKKYFFQYHNSSNDHDSHQDSKNLEER